MPQHQLSHDHPPEWPHVYKVFFLCERLSGEFTINDEISEIRYFNKDALPELSAARLTTAQLRRFFDFQENLNWPADYD